MNTLREAFMGKYPKYVRIVDFFSKTIGHEANWSDVTRLNLINFIDELQNEVAKSSTKTYCAMFRSVLNMYSEEVDIPCRDYAKILSVRNEQSTNTYLTEQEIKLLIEYVPENRIEESVRNVFVLSCVTGARHSDCIRLTRNNIVGDKISYVSVKTHTHTEIPLSPVVLRYIGKFDQVSAPTFNSTIREICRKCGINQSIKLFKAGNEVEGEKWEFISSHTARRSFATNIYISSNDVYLVSKFMGHSGIDMTLKYICTSGVPSENVLRYFKLFI